MDKEALVDAIMEWTRRLGLTPVEGVTGKILWISQEMEMGPFTTEEVAFVYKETHPDAN